MALKYPKQKNENDLHIVFKRIYRDAQLILINSCTLIK